MLLRSALILNIKGLLIACVRTCDWVLFVFRITYGEAIEVLRKHYDGVVPNVSMQASNTYTWGKGEREKKEKRIDKQKEKKKKREKKKEEKKMGTRIPYQGWGSNPCVHTHIGT